MKILNRYLLASLLVFPCVLSADGFGIGFKWLESSTCSGGYPDTEKNPVFELSNVPAGTTKIEFFMTDKDAPDFYHGGGTATYSGGAVVESGAFEYLGPCPPDTHTYVWEATAFDAGGKELGSAEATRKFPE